MPSTRSRAAAVRAKLPHPVVDADGHLIEVWPLMKEFIKQAGGSQILARLQRWEEGPWESLLDHHPRAGGQTMSLQERRDSGTPVPLWLFRITDTKYRATAHLPGLFYERMDEFGLDFSVIFPTQAIRFFTPGIMDDELRQACVRGYNLYVTELYRGYEERLTPAACIPMNTPTEAIAELEFCKRSGLKAAMFPSFVLRPVKRESGNRHIPDGRLAPYRLDLFALDSDYDYDPVWAKCVEVGIAPCFHSEATGLAWGHRASSSNTLLNFIGSFTDTGEAIAKALLWGGVTRRFPSIRFGLLEGGVARGLEMYSGVVGWWEKRTPEAIRQHADPKNIDYALLERLIGQYGHPLVRGMKDEFLQSLRDEHIEPPADVAGWDDWRHMQIKRKEDIRELFESHFYFGCEADDPLVPWAFKTDLIPLGAKVRPILSSDISHVDVPDPTEPLAEAYELVEHGHMAESDFKDFAFANAVRLYGGMNPAFFQGTRVERQAAEVLNAEPDAKA